MILNEDNIAKHKNDVFIYDGKEVKFTGRRAKKEIKSEDGKTSRIDTIYEVCPSKQENSAIWSYWVRLRDLYITEKF